MPQNLTHRVEFRTCGYGQCRSRVAAAMEGKFLPGNASLIPDAADVLCHIARHRRQMKYVLIIIFWTCRQQRAGQVIQWHRHRSSRLMLDDGYRPAFTHGLDVAPPKPPNVTQPESRHAGEAESRLDLMFSLRCRLHVQESD